MKLVVAATLTALLIGARAQAQPTPIPGGADQITAVSAKLGQTVWNGAIRFTLVDVREATPDEVKAYLPNPGQKVMVFDVAIQNGTHGTLTDLFHYTFADKDEVAVPVRDGDVTHANLSVLQGASAKQKGVLAVDKDFTPIKLLVQCATCPAKSSFKSIRVSLAP